MKVKNLMTTEVKSCRDYCTLNAAAQLMWDHDIGCLPVVDHENRVIGMLTDRDVCMSAYMQGVPLTAASVTSAMSKVVFSCLLEDEHTFVERMMREKQIHRIPVVDENGHLLGIVSLNDIAREAVAETETKKPRQVNDTEIICAIAAVSAPRHRLVEVTREAA